MDFSKFLTIKIKISDFVKRHLIIVVFGSFLINVLNNKNHCTSSQMFDQKFDQNINKKL